jgi:hypothetical protein
MKEVAGFFGRPAEQQCQNYLLCQFAKYVACLH